MLRRYKKYLVLGVYGHDFIKLKGMKSQSLVYQDKYADRLKFMSHLAALYNKDKYISFIPSFEMKDKEVFTETARKYIGILNIFGTKYLTYHISENHSKHYINSVIYDLQKEMKHKNVIVLVDDLSRIKISDFAFGLNSVIICKDSDDELNQLKYLHQINWKEIIEQEYNTKVNLSEYNFCEYVGENQKYFTSFFFIDGEKINRIDTFLRNNKNKKIDVVCNELIINYLGKEIPLSNFRIININDYIEKDINVYE